LTHWSSRELARHVGIDHATIARLWQQWGLQPWRLATFKRSTDPEFEAKLRGVVGLYMDPPEVMVTGQRPSAAGSDRAVQAMRIRLARMAGSSGHARGGVTIDSVVSMAVSRTSRVAPPAAPSRVRR